jgi:enediyne biosynthesis protein E4
MNCRFISLLLSISLFSAGCRQQTTTPQPAAKAPLVPVETKPPLHFTDATRQSGIRFKHHNGAFGLKLFPETMGSGVAWFDYNGDNWPDLFFVNGRDWTSQELKQWQHRPWSQSEVDALRRIGGKRQRTIPSFKRKRATGALYRNNRDGTFTDVTAGSGIDVEMYGMGATPGDYDGDGRCDLFVTSYPRNYLFRNLGNGRFDDVTVEAGLQDDGLNTSAAWLDYDRDGRLDLFVARYVDWRPNNDVFHSLDGVNKSYSRPRAYKARVCYLYRNVRAAARSGARFQNVSMPSGVGQQPSPIFGGKLFPLEGNALGVAVFDWNNDGWLDIAVANDTTPNHLLENTGKGAFKEIGRKAGMAMTAQGMVRAGMGIDTADIHHTNRDCLLIGNFAEEMLGLFEYQNGVFVDTAFNGPVGIASYKFLTFGLSFADFDNDSWPDFITANGHINDDVARTTPGLTYEQRPQIFLLRMGRYFEVGEQAGPDAAQPLVGRGLACADYDLDGDVDVVITSNGKAPTLLRNDSPARFPQFTGVNHSVRLTLIGADANRDAIGALIEAKSGGELLRRWVRSGSSYLSQNELPVTLGIGKAKRVDEMTVRWPNGKSSRFKNLSVGQNIVIAQNKGVISRQTLLKALPKD